MPANVSEETAIGSSARTRRHAFVLGSQRGARGGTRRLRLHLAGLAMLLFAGIASATPVAQVAATGLDPDKAITQYVHDVWGTKEGLPHRAVRSVVQTRDGYLWLATAEGVARFDGVRFTVFNTRNTPAIGNDNIRTLFADGDGALWIGTYGGGVTRFKNGLFTRYTTRDGLVSDIVFRISAARGGGVWIGTKGGASRLRDGRFTNLTTKDGLANNLVFSIHEDRQGSTWFGTYGGGVSRLRDGRFTTFTKAHGLGSNIVFDILEDAGGVLWVGTYAGLARFDGDRITLFTKQDGLSDDSAVALHQDRAGTLWIATTGGLSRLSNGRFSTYVKRDGLTDNFGNALCEDREGSLWVGTSDGLNRFRNGKVTTYGIAEGLSSDAVHAIYQDAAGMWIGTEGGGLNRFDQGTFTAFTTAHGLADNAIMSLGGDQAGNLWVGTTEAGLSRLNNGKVTHFGTAHGVSGVDYAIAGGADGDVWIGTSEGLFHGRDGTFTQVGQEAGLGNSLVRSLKLARNRDLWIGTNDGLVRLRNGTFKTFTVRDGLAGNIVAALHEDDDGAIWIGSKDGGLTRLKDGRFFAYAAHGGLPNAVICQILEDDRGHLWVSEPSHLLQVSKLQLNAFAEGTSKRVVSTSYGEDDGIRGADFECGTQPAGWKARDGKLWFASMGAVVIDPERIPFNRLPPPVRIEQVTNEGRTIALRNGVVLPPGAGNIEIDYTALSLAVPARVRFRYRLAGFDEQWIDAGTRRAAYYTNLPPGRYRFQVIASNDDGVWNWRGDSFAFELQPFFYQTRWFFAACVVLMLLLAFAAHRVHIRHLRQRQVELATLVEERTYLLGKANQKLHDIATLDELTNIANRRAFDEKLEEEWGRARRNQAPLSAVMIDIDEFKAFNDHYGHQGGDECLRRVAGALKQGMSRSGDMIARYGGEEFVALLPGTDAAGAAVIGERLRALVEAQAIPHEYARAWKTVTISAGIGTVFPHLEGTHDDLIAQADRRLYRAKETGRNRVEPFDAPA